ncbi:iron-containing alcohol dehydrogenase family protein [Enterococcus sp. LJL120]
MIRFSATTAIIFGEGAVLELSAELEKLQAKSVLAIYDQGIKSTGLIDTILGRLIAEGLTIYQFDQVIANPTDVSIEAAANDFKGKQIDVIVAIGGGSSIDSAKAINVLLTNEAPIQQYEGIDQVPNPTVPLIAIETAAGTGSEVTSVSVVTCTKRKKKMVISGKYTTPTVAILDPQLTVGLPPQVTASTGCDALTHAIESYVSTLGNPFTEIHSLKAIELIYQNLPTAVKDGQNLTARSRVLMGSTLAGMAFNVAILGIAHSIAHPLGAHFNVPHGLANAMALAETVKYNARFAAEKYQKVGVAMGLGADCQAEDVVKALEELNVELNIPALNTTGIQRADFDIIAKAAMEEPSNDMNPAPVSYEMFMDVLEKIYEK